MSIINEDDLKIIENDNNFIKYKNQKAKFNTKIASNMKHNGEVVDVIGVISGRDEEHDSYIVKFNDDTIGKNIMSIELKFNYIKDPVQEDMRRKLSRINQLTLQIRQKATQMLNTIKR